MNSFLRTLKFAIKNGYTTTVPYAKCSYGSHFNYDEVLTILKNIDDRFKTGYVGALKEILNDDLNIKSSFNMRFYINMDGTYRPIDRKTPKSDKFVADFTFGRIKAGGRRFKITNIVLTNTRGTKISHYNPESKTFEGDVTISDLGYIEDGVTANVCKFIIDSRHPIRIYFETK